MHATDTIEKWLASLGVLCAGTMRTDEAKTRIAAFAPMLADEFPPQFFTRESLRFVAGKCRFFPAYGEIAEHLKAWKSEQKFGMPGPLPSNATRIAGRVEGRARPRVTIVQLVEHEMGYRPLPWTDYGIYPYTAEERAEAEADVRARMEYRKANPPKPLELRRPSAIKRPGALVGDALAAARAATGRYPPAACASTRERLEAGVSEGATKQ